MLNRQKQPTTVPAAFSPDLRQSGGSGYRKADYRFFISNRCRCILQTNKLLPVVKKEYSFFASIPAGVTLGVNTLKGYVSQMKYLFL